MDCAHNIGESRGFLRQCPKGTDFHFLSKQSGKSGSIKLPCGPKHQLHRPPGPTVCGLHFCVSALDVIRPNVWSELEHLSHFCSLGRRWGWVRPCRHEQLCWCGRVRPFCENSNISMRKHLRCALQPNGRRRKSRLGMG